MTFLRPYAQLDVVLTGGKATPLRVACGQP